MRKIVQVKQDDEIQRLMVYACDGGIYLFLYPYQEDCGASADLWFETLEDALSYAEETYGVTPNAWQDIADPEPYCQHDWIAPVRIPGREKGQPQWGTLERKENGQWVPLKIPTSS